MFQMVAMVVGAGLMRAGEVHAEKAKKAQKSANKMQQKINKLQNAQAKRDFLRQYRQQLMNILSAGVAAGIGLESSVVQGARSGTEAQMRQGVFEFELMDKWAVAQGKYLNQVASHQYRSNFYMAHANVWLGMAGAGGPGGSAYQQQGSTTAQNLSGGGFGGGGGGGGGGPSGGSTGFGGG